MNRAINILLLVVSFPALAFSIIVGFDLPIDFLRTTGAMVPHRDIAFLCFALILLLLVLRRTVRRWVGVGMTRKPERFIWYTDIGPGRKKQVRMYLLIEAITAFCFGYAIYTVTPEALPIAVVYAFLGLDHLAFLFIAIRWYRVGVTQKAVVVADREVSVLYFSGLRRIETHQQTVYFEYIQDLQLFFPINCIPSGSYADFRAALDQRIDRDKVYYSAPFKALN